MSPFSRLPMEQKELEMIPRMISSIIIIDNFLKDKKIRKKELTLHLLI